MVETVSLFQHVKEAIMSVKFGCTQCKKLIQYTSRDLRYISIRQCISTISMHYDTILH